MAGEAPPEGMLAKHREDLQNACKQLNIHPDVFEELKLPRETLAATLLIRMDDGSRRAFKAWRCRYNDRRGPTKGGVRFHPRVNQDEIETLAFWMTFPRCRGRSPAAATTMESGLGGRALLWHSGCSFPPTAPR